MLHSYERSIHKKRVTIRSIVEEGIHNVIGCDLVIVVYKGIYSGVNRTTQSAK